MNILEFEEVYTENKKLDAKFEEAYGYDDDIILKTKLELLVEIGELCNETRCFKFWSKKSANREATLEEYADVLMMVLYFFNKSNITLTEEFPTYTSEDVNNKFITLFGLASEYRDDTNNEVIKEIFVNVLELGRLLSFTTDEIKMACLNKIRKTMNIFDSDY